LNRNLIHFFVTFKYISTLIFQIKTFAPASTTPTITRVRISRSRRRRSKSHSSQKVFYAAVDLIGKYSNDTTTATAKTAKKSISIYATFHKEIKFEMKIHYNHHLMLLFSVLFVEFHSLNVANKFQFATAFLCV
jgi:hypothetical protein